MPVGITTIGNEGKRSSATFTVAASDSLHRERADYVCVGVDDQNQIQAAIDALQSGVGKVTLLDGLYIKGNTTGIRIPSNVEIELLSGGTIQLADGLNTDAEIFTNYDSAGNENISIHGGGILDGNRANQNAGDQGAINFKKTKSSLVDISMKNFRSYHVRDTSGYGNNKIINREFPNVSSYKTNILSKLETHPLWELIDDFETDCWSGAEGTLTYDTGVKHCGTRSAKIVTGATEFAKKDKTISPTMDMSKKELSMWFYVEDESKLDYIELDLRSGGSWDHHRLTTLRENISPRCHVNDHWVWLGSSKWASPVGNFDVKNVDMIRIIVHAKTGETATIWVDKLRYATQSVARKGMITFMFDDGWIDAYTRAKQCFDKYNYSACSAVITSLINGSGMYMNREQLKELQQSGWDVIAHSATHAYQKDGINVEDSRALIEEEVLKSQDWLLQHGFSKGARFYVYPGGYTSKEYADVIEEYFLAARATNGFKVTSTPLPLVDPRYIVTRVIDSWASVDAVKGLIDAASDRGGWQIFTLHKIVDGGASGGDWNKADLESIIEYIHNKNIPIVTLSQVFDDILFAPTQTISYSDLFMDVLAVSATHVRLNEDLSEAIPNTFTITAQPDVLRTLSGHFDSHAQITAYTIVITGTDAKGNTVTETFTEAASPWDFETANAYATITSIIMTARTGTGAADTMDIGITDVLGLSNIIYETGDVFKIKKNNANATVVAAQVNTTYDTYDMSVIGLAATDDFTIWYKSNLNIIS